MAATLWRQMVIKSDNDPGLYDMPVDLDKIVNRPPPEDDAIVKFALRIVL